MARRLLASFIAAFLLAACGGDDDDDSAGAGSNPLEPTGLAAMDAICDATEMDPAEAEKSFHAIHNELHDIGDALTAEDRTKAAEFLRAKSKVEADLSGDATADTLSADLDSLANELRKALDTLEIEADC